MGSLVISEQGWRKGPWTHEEDKLLIEYVRQYGEGRWSCVSKCAGLNRSGKSSRLRWVNYLRPGLKKGHITPQEAGIIIELHAIWGNKWSTIARYLPGRTDNEIKNYWRTHFKKRNPSRIINEEKRKLFRKQKQEEQIQGNATSINECPRATDQEASTDGKDDKPLDMGIVYDNNQLLPMISQDSGFWSDFILIDNCLWGGLWNPDDQDCCSKMMDIQNQENVGTSSWEGDGNIYGQNGGYIF